MRKMRKDWRLAFLSFMSIRGFVGIVQRRGVVDIFRKALTDARAIGGIFHELSCQHLAEGAGAFDMPARDIIPAFSESRDDLYCRYLRKSPVFFVVVDGQDAKNRLSGSQTHHRWGRAGGFSRRGVGLLQRNLEAKTAAPAHPALHREPPTHQLDYAAADGQPQAGAFGVPAAFRLIESLEYPLEILRRDARTGILDRDRETLLPAVLTPIIRPDTRTDGSGFCELDGVSEQIDQYSSRVPPLPSTCNAASRRTYASKCLC